MSEPIDWEAQHRLCQELKEFAMKHQVAIYVGGGNSPRVPDRDAPHVLVVQKNRYQSKKEE
jgi:uridylate kinase